MGSENLDELGGLSHLVTIIGAFAVSSCLVVLMTISRKIWQILAWILKVKAMHDLKTQRVSLKQNWCHVFLSIKSHACCWRSFLGAPLGLSQVQWFHAISISGGVLSESQLWNHSCHWAMSCAGMSSVYSKSARVKKYEWTHTQYQHHIIQHYNT